MNMAIGHKGFYGDKLALIVANKLAVILRGDKLTFRHPIIGTCLGVDVKGARHRWNVCCAKLMKS
jgi:hypothetical protein